MANEHLENNVASPVGVWLRDGKTVYRLKEVTAGPSHRRFHDGKPLRENEVCFQVWADDEAKAINLAERIRELLAGGE
jgi:hypothetical protein